MKNKIIRIIVILAIAVIIIDQVSKLLIIKNGLTMQIGEFVKIEQTLNTGMALGLNEGNMRNAIIMILVLAIVIAFIKNQLERIDTKTAVSVGLILGGGLSNLIDRFTRQGVVDFLSIYKFPTINLADCFIFIGWVLFIVFLIMYTRQKVGE